MVRRAVRVGSRLAQREAARHCPHRYSGKDRSPNKTAIWEADETNGSPADPISCLIAPPDRRSISSGETRELRLGPCER